MDFHYKLINKRQVLMESQKISEWRVNYLHQIKQFRDENRTIIYLDETWYDTHDTVKKVGAIKVANVIWMSRRRRLMANE